MRQQSKPLHEGRGSCSALLDFWLTEEEKQGIAATSSSSVYRVLGAAGRLDRFVPRTEHLAPHYHWHIDVAYANQGGTFYNLISVVDGRSRYLVHSELRGSMTETDRPTSRSCSERVREKYLDVRPRIIADNGTAFTTKDLEVFLRQAGRSTRGPGPLPAIERQDPALSPHHQIRGPSPTLSRHPRRGGETPQGIHPPLQPRSLASAIGYAAPAASLSSRRELIWAERDRNAGELHAI